MESTEMKTKEESVGKDAVTIVSAGVTLEGKLSSNGNVRVDGKVNGDVKAEGNITIGENGEIRGQINANTITLGGKVEGTISAKEKIVLEAKCQLKGDIITKVLVVEEGAKFDGKSSMNNKDYEQKEISVQAKSYNEKPR
jgi:cytoskeletal protein CcmA (bactofilin family)